MRHTRQNVFASLFECGGMKGEESFRQCSFRFAFLLLVDKETAEGNSKKFHISPYIFFFPERYIYKTNANYSSFLNEFASRKTSLARSVFFESCGCCTVVVVSPRVSSPQRNETLTWCTLTVFFSFPNDISSDRDDERRRLLPMNTMITGG